MNVARNFNCPRFEGTPYQASFNRDEQIGYEVESVNARDSDNTSPYNKVKYSIIGDDNAPTYFSINEETGRVTISRSMNEDIASVYKVST